jgi:hypothetical protein
VTGRGLLIIKPFSECSTQPTETFVDLLHSIGRNHSWPAVCAPPPLVPLGGPTKSQVRLVKVHCNACVDEAVDGVRWDVVSLWPQAAATGRQKAHRRLCYDSVDAVRQGCDVADAASIADSQDEAAQNMQQQRRTGEAVAGRRHVAVVCRDQSVATGAVVWWHRQWQAQARVVLLKSDVAQGGDGAGGGGQQDAAARRFGRRASTVAGVVLSAPVLIPASILSQSWWGVGPECVGLAEGEQRECRRGTDTTRWAAACCKAALHQGRSVL